jgi:hypothetical protein
MKLWHARSLADFTSQIQAANQFSKFSFDWNQLKTLVHQLAVSSTELIQLTLVNVRGTGG